MSRKRVRVDPPAVPPPVRPRLSALQTGFVVLRDLVPLALTWWTDGPTGQFLALSLFNVLFGAVAIATVGAAVSTRQDGGPAATGGPLRTFAMAAAIGLAIALGMTTLFGWCIAVVFPGDVLLASTLWSLLAIAVAALPGQYAHYRADLVAGLPEPVRKRRDQPAIMALVLSAFAISLLCLFAIDLGRYARLPLLLAITALSMLRDLRPDLIGTLFPTERSPPPA